MENLQVIGVYPLCNFGGYEFAYKDERWYARTHYGEEVSDWEQALKYTDENGNTTLILENGNVLIDMENIMRAGV